MMVLVYRFYKAGELVLVTCTGTMETAKTCSQLPEHLIFVGHERTVLNFRTGCRHLWRYTRSWF